ADEVIAEVVRDEPENVGPRRLGGSTQARERQGETGYGKQLDSRWHHLASPSCERFPPRALDVALNSRSKSFHVEAASRQQVFGRTGPTDPAGYSTTRGGPRQVKRSRRQIRQAFTARRSTRTNFGSVGPGT